MAVTPLLRPFIREENPITLTARELAFRVICRHRQGDAPNIFLYCTRRSGSTWILNTLAAHPGMRYVGKPFWALLRSRWRHLVPSLAKAAGQPDDYSSDQLIQFRGEQRQQMLELAKDIALTRKHIYPTLTFSASYFQRRTDRVVFQMTTANGLILEFHQYLPIQTVLLFRHPIPTALSTMHLGWRPEANDFLRHQSFVESHLSAAELAIARDVMASDSVLAHHVLDWTLKMLLPTRLFRSGCYPEWTVLSYEETVLQPEETVRVLSHRLGLPDEAAMLEQIGRPSRTALPPSREIIDNREQLIGRWRESVDLSERRNLMRIPEAFGIDLYGPDDRLPRFEFLRSYGK